MLPVVEPAGTSQTVMQHRPEAEEAEAPEVTTLEFAPVEPERQAVMVVMSVTPSSWPEAEAEVVSPEQTVKMASQTKEETAVWVLHRPSQVLLSHTEVEVVQVVTVLSTLQEVTVPPEVVGMVPIPQTLATTLHSPGPLIQAEVVEVVQTTPAVVETLEAAAEDPVS